MVYLDKTSTRQNKLNGYIDYNRFNEALKKALISHVYSCVSIYVYIYR